MQFQNYLGNYAHVEWSFRTDKNMKRVTRYDKRNYKNQSEFKYIRVLSKVKKLIIKKIRLTGKKIFDEAGIRV